MTPIQEGAKAVREAGWTHPPRHAAACTHPHAGTVLPASVMLHLAPCHRAASSGALPCARERMSPAARTLCAREAPAACRGFGKAQGSLWRATLIGHIAFSCRAQFCSYKVFSPQARVREVHRQAGREEQDRKAGSLDAGLGTSGAEPRSWHEKTWVQPGHRHIQDRKRRQLLPD